MLLTINKCARHGYWAIGIDHEDGTGERLTHSKCCGQWETVRAFHDVDWSRIAKIAGREVRRQKRFEAKRGGEGA